MIKVYIAGPYSQGDMVRNIRNAIDAADKLLGNGFAVFVPHLFFMHNLVHEHTYETWLRHDRVWVESCDALLRLPGESPGANREVIWAKECGVPVCHTVDELIHLRRKGEI